MSDRLHWTDPPKDRKDISELAGQRTASRDAYI